MPDFNDEVTLSDEVKTEVETVSMQPERQSYKVISANGLLKNGETYKKGSKVQLDAQTAANFIAAGDIEDPNAGESDQDNE